MNGCLTLNPILAPQEPALAAVLLALLAVAALIASSSQEAVVARIARQGRNRAGARIASHLQQANLQHSADRAGRRTQVRAVQEDDTGTDASWCAYAIDAL